MNYDEINCADASWDGWHMSNVVEYADYANAFADGAEWYAAGMAVCSFLEDLARLRASPPPVSSDGVKNILNQIEAFSTAMRRTWGEP